MQFVFFAMMPGLHDGFALAVAVGFMLGAFGQIPINDFMIGKMASGEARARVYGVRYVVSFTAARGRPAADLDRLRALGFRHPVQDPGYCGLDHFRRGGRLPARLPTPAPARGVAADG